jgi:hypothetical protein
VLDSDGGFLEVRRFCNIENLPWTSFVVGGLPPVLCGDGRFCLLGTRSFVVGLSFWFFGGVFSGGSRHDLRQRNGNPPDAIELIKAPRNKGLQIQGVCQQQLDDNISRRRMEEERGDGLDRWPDSCLFRRRRACYGSSALLGKSHRSHQATHHFSNALPTP